MKTVSLDQVTVEALALPWGDRATILLKIRESLPEPKGIDLDPDWLREEIRREALKKGALQQ